jgi:hypothetical protein
LRGTLAEEKECGGLYRANLYKRKAFPRQAALLRVTAS